MVLYVCIFLLFILCVALSSPLSPPVKEMNDYMEVQIDKTYSNLLHCLFGGEGGGGGCSKS